MISLREADANDKILVFTITQHHQPIPKANYRWRGSPGVCQRPDPNGAVTLRSTCATKQQSTAHRERDEDNATDNEFSHDTCSFV